MKKLFLLFITVLTCYTMSGQQHYSTIREVVGGQGDGSGGREISCPENTVYSHIYNGNSGFTSWTSSPYTVYDQMVSAPGLIGEVVFFGASDYNLEPDRNFEIKFYYDNGGLPGDQYASYAVFLQGINTGELLIGYYNVLSYTYTLPSPINVSAGDWMSVRADGSEYWYWCSADGGDGCVQQEGYAFRCDYGDVAFCLVEGIPPTPLSPWALGIAIALIATAVIFRTRRSV